MNGDAELGFLCIAAGLNLFLFIPIGALIGHCAKNRAIEGAALGFLFGPIGWLFVAFLNDYRRLCPACRTRVPRDARKCWRCGDQCLLAILR